MRRLFAITLMGGCSLIVDPVDPDNPETTINVIGTGDQSDPSAAFAGGRYLVAWKDESGTPPDTSAEAIRARFVSQAGVPDGTTDILINDSGATASGRQLHPQLAALGDKILVAWDDSSGVVDLNESIRARVIPASGSYRPIVLVNTTIDAKQNEVEVASAANAFVLVWTDESMAAGDVTGSAIRGRRLTPDGTPIEAADFVINTKTAGNQTQPAVACGKDNRCLVVWTDSATVGESDIRGRLLGADGTPQGQDIQIDPNTLGTQNEPFVVATGDGYLVGWTNFDAGRSSIRGRLVDSAGTPRSAGDVPLTSTTEGNEYDSTAIVLADGSIFLAFEHEGQLRPDTNAKGVRARRLNADATPASDDFQVNTRYAGEQEDPSLATDGVNVLVVWEDASAPPPDGSENAVRGRVYAPAK